jgi:hypothetical protein
VSTPGVSTPEVSTPEAGTSGRGGARWLTALDVVLAAVVGLAVLIVHDVPYLLHHAYWLDEGWVADSARAPLGLIMRLHSASPLGWTFLVHLVFAGGEQRQRVVPLAFAGLAAVAGYLLGRELRLGRFTTGLLTGAAILLSPAMLVHDDLKQYTAEGFLSLLVWLCVVRVENEWNRRRLAVLAAVASFGTLFGSTVIFTGIAAIGCLGLECLVRRRYGRLKELAVAAAGMLAVFAVIYAAVLRSSDNRALTVYWTPYYIPKSLGPALSFLGKHLSTLGPYMGFPWLWLNVSLALAGIVALVLLGRIALAALLPITLLILIVAGLAKIYPFGDIRTSTFWIAMVPLLMAIAVAATAHWLGRHGPARAGVWVPVVLTAVALAAWTGANRPYIRSHAIDNEDVRTSVFFVEKQYRPGDVIIVNYASSYEFAYYYKTPPTGYVPDAGLADGFYPTYSGIPWIIVMNGRGASDVTAALSQAKAELAREGARSTGRIWIIRTHLFTTEADAWQQDLAGGKVTTYKLTDEPVLLYQPK